MADDAAQPSACDRCGGPLEPATVGSLFDKVLRCAFCGVVRDVPDAVKLTHEERIVRTGPLGHFERRVQSVVHRVDGPVSSADLPPELPEEARRFLEEAMHRADPYEGPVDLRQLESRDIQVHTFTFGHRQRSHHLPLGTGVVVALVVVGVIALVVALVTF